MRHAVLVAALVGAAGSTRTLAQFSGFEPLNTPGSSLRGVTPTDLNADGSVVVGFGYTPEGFGIYLPIRRLAGQPLEQLGLYSSETRARAFAVNANGAFIVGGGDSEGFWWVPPGPNVGSATPPLLDVNDDGSVFISQTTRYQGLDSPSDFPNIPTYTSLKAARLNAVGDAAALTCNYFEPGNGYGYPPQPPIDISQAARWTSDGGTQGIGFLPTGNNSYAVGISADGAVVVGHADVAVSPSQTVSRPFRWNSIEGMQAIPMLPGPADGSGTASDSNADGSIIVGTSNGRAFIWDAVHGTRDLQALIDANGHDTTGWTLLSADAISDDGLTVAGMGILSGSSELEGWVANLSRTCNVPDSVGSVSLEIVAHQDGLATGTPQAFGVSLNPSDLTPDGKVAFNALLANGTLSCYTGVPGSLSLIALANGAPYISPSLARLTASNQAAIRDVRVFSPPPETKFLYYAGAVNAVSILVQPGTAAPQTGGGTFNPLVDGSSELFLNNADTFALQSVIADGTTGIAAYATVGGLLTRSFVSLPGGATSLANPRLLALTDTGALVRRGNIDAANGPEVLLIGGPPPAPAQVVAQVGTQAPGEAVGVTYSDLLDAVAEGNSLAFLAELSSGDSALFKGTASSVQQVAKIGSVVDDLPARTIESFVPSNGFALLPSGETLFIATLTESGVSKRALLRASSSGIRSLVVQGDTKLPGYPVCRAVRDVSLVASDGERSLLAATPLLAADTGLYVLSAQGLTKLAQVDDTIELAPGLSGQISQIAPPGGGPAARTGRDGRGTFLRDTTATFQVTVETAGGPKHALLRAVFTLPGNCPCDLNHDGFVDDADFVLFLPAYNVLDCFDPGMIQGCRADLNGDFVVDDGDFILFVAAYNDLLCP
ncbi:MAG: hypothetical protein JSS51_07155 [Planctomycetes bacterium]|nr:hypothetical protein [Planctomycetota bacterium]